MIIYKNSHDFWLLFTALPDPPMDVRVDGGPQDGTILVTWIPVTLNTTSAQRVVPVTGYAVFADGKRVTDVDSPSSDHALVDLGIDFYSNFYHFFFQISNMFQNSRLKHELK